MWSGIYKFITHAYSLDMGLEKAQRTTIYVEALTKWIPEIKMNNNIKYKPRKARLLIPRVTILTYLKNPVLNKKITSYTKKY